VILGAAAVIMVLVRAALTPEQAPQSAGRDTT